MSLILGTAIEKRIALFLKNRGLKLIANNYRCRWGEIDLIMQDDNYLVFVEVRQRSNANYGGALESITQAKRNKLIKTASHYLLCQRLTEKCLARFDVVSVDGEDNQIQWVKNAIELN